MIFHYDCYQQRNHPVRSHRILSILLLFLVIVGITSCGQKDPLNTTVKFQVEPSAGAVLAGGAMIYGLGPNGALFSMALDSSGNSRSLRLANGNWRFLALGWSGAGLTGTVYCESTGQLLSGSDTTAKILLSSAKCANESFHTSSAQLDGVSNPFASLKMYSCSDLSTISNGTMNCHSSPDLVGQNLSYRVVLREFGVGTGELDVLPSSCFNRAGSADSEIDLSSLHIPLASPHQSLYQVVVYAYRKINCAGDRSGHYYPNGPLAGGTLINKIFTTKVDFDQKAYTFTTNGKNGYALYLADNSVGAGDTVFREQMPSYLSCSGSVCVPKGSGFDSSNQTGRLKYNYYRLMGTPDGYRIYPSANAQYEGVESGLMGKIREELGPGGFGGYLYRQKFTLCSQLPTSATYNLTEGTKKIRLVLGTGSKTIPSGWTGETATFERKLLQYSDDVLTMQYEFNCTAAKSKTGYLRYNWVETDISYSDYGLTTQSEIWFDGNNSNNQKFEEYSYSLPTAGSAITNKAYFFRKFDVNLSHMIFWNTQFEYKNSNWTGSQEVGGIAYTVSGGSSTDPDKFVYLDQTYSSTSIPNSTFSDFSISGWSGIGRNVSCGQPSVSTPSGTSFGSCNSYSFTLSNSFPAPIAIHTSSISLNWVLSQSCPSSAGMSCAMNSIGLTDNLQEEDFIYLPEDEDAIYESQLNSL